MITIPTEDTPAQRTDPRLLMIYGAPKIGKSTILSLLPKGKYLILSTDPRGWEFLGGRYIQINNILEFVETERAIKAMKERPDFVGIDTVDNVEDWAKIEATRLYKLTPVGKNFQGDSILSLPNGGGYDTFWNVFTNVITRCLDLAPQVIFTGHVRDKLIGQINGQDEVFTKDLNLTGKVRTIFTSMVDSTGYLSRDKDSNLNIAFKTHDLIVNGSRAAHLRGVNMKMEGSKFDWSRIYPDYYNKIKGTL
jgi:hypothetical protein